jgi:hypothetical protein
LVVHQQFERSQVEQLAFVVQPRVVRRSGFRRCAVRQWSSPLRDLAPPRRACACRRHTRAVSSGSI